MQAVGLRCEAEELRIGAGDERLVVCEALQNKLEHAMLRRPLRVALPHDSGVLHPHRFHVAAAASRASATAASVAVVVLEPDARAAGPQQRPTAPLADSR